LTGRRPGVLLMTYGSPRTAAREDVRAYLARVRGGREADPALVDEFTRRYQVIGGSPLIDITRQQGAALALHLGWPVEVGMRFSEPSIEQGLSRLAEAAVTDVAAIILSPQYSPALMRGYAAAIDAALAAIGPRAPVVRVAGAWHDQPAFITALADRVVDALARLSQKERDRVRVLMTAHSLPRAVAVNEPRYLEQLRATAIAVAAAADVSPERWTFCWQSAGHEPGEWMTPDFADIMPGIGASEASSVLVVPIQFLSDHLEVLYDIDVGAHEQAQAHGVTFRRIESLNTDVGLITALVSVATETVWSAPASELARESP
jgi:ferrochelatase